MMAMMAMMVTVTVTVTMVVMILTMVIPFLVEGPDKKRSSLLELSMKYANPLKPTALFGSMIDF